MNPKVIECGHCKRSIADPKSFTIFTLIIFGIGLNYSDLLMYFFNLNLYSNIWFGLSTSLIVCLLGLVLVYYVFPLKCPIQKNEKDESYGDLEL